MGSRQVRAIVLLSPTRACKGHQVRGRAHPAQGRPNLAEMRTALGLPTLSVICPPFHGKQADPEAHRRLRRQPSTARRPRAADLTVFRSNNHILRFRSSDDGGRTPLCVRSRRPRPKDHACASLRSERLLAMLSHLQWGSWWPKRGALAKGIPAGRLFDRGWASLLLTWAGAQGPCSIDLARRSPGSCSEPDPTMRRKSDQQVP